MGLSSNGRPSVLDYVAIVVVSLLGYYFHGAIGAVIGGGLLLAVFVAVEYLVIIPAQRVQAIEDEIMDEDPPDKDESG